MVNNNQYKIEKVTENEILWARKDTTVILPTKIDENADYDIYAFFEEDYMILAPHETKMIPTGLYVALNKKYKLQLCERGSTGTKGIGQRAGEIDSGFRGEIKVPITNHNNKPLIIIKKEFLQLIDGCKFSFTDMFFSKCDNIFISKIRNRGIYNEIILYPYEKAITQGAIVEIPQMISKEISVEELQAIPSERGTGMLGSSNK